MARVRTKYRNASEKNAALKQAEEQYNRARKSLDSSTEGGIAPIYFGAQYAAYMSQPRVRKLKEGGKAKKRERDNAWEYASGKERYRASQLEKAYQNRVNAISSASING